jgi:hypothetical protein
VRFGDRSRCVECYVTSVESTFVVLFVGFRIHRLFGVRQLLPAYSSIANDDMPADDRSASARRDLRGDSATDRELLVSSAEGSWRLEPRSERLGRTSLPGLEIRQQYPLYAISKRSTDPQHSLKVAAPGAGHKLALVGGMCDLIQVAPDAPKLADGALESQ